MKIFSRSFIDPADYIKNACITCAYNTLSNNEKPRAVSLAGALLGERGLELSQLVFSVCFPVNSSIMPQEIRFASLRTMSPFLGVYRDNELRRFVKTTIS